MILSDRPRGASARVRTGPSGRGVVAPEPKAVCPGCGRPVGMLRLGRCLYCGVAVETSVAGSVPAAPPGPAAAPEPGPALPPEVLQALAPRGSGSASRRLWTLRLGAVAFVLLALLGMVALFGSRP